MEDLLVEEHCVEAGDGGIDGCQEGAYDHEGGADQEVEPSVVEVAYQGEASLK